MTLKKLKRLDTVRIKNCRACGNPLNIVFCDLGMSPISNAFVSEETSGNGEIFYPLRALACQKCWLVQIDTMLPSEVHFHSEYVYFSSFSESWLAHAKKYVTDVTKRFALSGDSQVIEIASNDGYLLQYFRELNIPCLGIEPTANTAKAARQKGVETRELFFNSETARTLLAENLQCDLILGNNVLAHVPDIHDFVSGVPIILKAEGVATFEFPHALRMIQENQFDTIYHEHYSYLSLTALQPILKHHGLRVFDVEHLPTHGGSLRLYICHENAKHIELGAVQAAMDEEAAAGLSAPDVYQGFADKVRQSKLDLLDFLVSARKDGKTVAGYGAAAKGNTILNYVGAGTDLISFVVDKNPAKQGLLLPGSHIPVVHPDAVLASKPDYLLILPWNIRDEVCSQMAYIRDWGGQFVVAIPSLQVF